MATYFVVFMREVEDAAVPPEPKFEGGEVLANPQDARVVKVSAESVGEAQRLVEHYFPGEITTLPVVVTETQFKES